MKTEQELQRLGLRIKLFKCHVREWNELLVHQKQVRLFAQEETDRHSFTRRESPIVLIEQVTIRVNQLTLLSKRQAEERYQMTARHQQEAHELEQVLKTKTS